MGRRTTKASKVSQAQANKEVFSVTLGDYNILMDETLKNLGYLRRKTEKTESSMDQHMLNDPTD